MKKVNSTVRILKDNVIVMYGKTTIVQRAFGIVIRVR